MRSFYLYRLACNICICACVHLLFVSYCAAASRNAVKSFLLDDRTVYDIPVPVSNGVTTIMFPAASSVTRDPAQKADFLITFKPNTYYFSIRALKSDAKDGINVIFNNKIYVLNVQASDKPFRSVTFFTETSSGTSFNDSAFPPSKVRLLSLLDKAKIYTVLEKQASQQWPSVDYAKPARIMLYKDFRVLIDEIWRFDPEDTIVFHLLLENNSEDAILYKPQDISIRVRERIFYQSVADASGVMPPQSTTHAYVAFTGNPNGTRAHLSLDNAFNVLVPRVFPLEAKN